MTVYLIGLERVETRYTAQWADYVPRMLRNAGLNVVVIEGPADIPPATSPGAFLNFGGTNIWKADQVKQISELFCQNEIKAGDYFLFTDAWHPGIINLKYMSELLNIPVKIGGLWHAGNFDPQDFLGRLIGDAPWVKHAEESFFHCIDHNYFATDFIIDMFSKAYGDPDYRPDWIMSMMDDKKIVRTGWPMDYMPHTLAAYKNLPKRDLILFPHRIAPEKQVEIFRDLAKHLPQYEFVVCQDQQLTKYQYHTLLGQAKMVFSCSLQETLGISNCGEGPLLDCIPLSPSRLSYAEVFNNYTEFLYPSEWTENWDSYQKHQNLIIEKIKGLMNHYEEIIPKLKQYSNTTFFNYFRADQMLSIIKSNSLTAGSK